MTQFTVSQSQFNIFQLIPTSRCWEPEVGPGGCVHHASSPPCREELRSSQSESRPATLRTRADVLQIEGPSSNVASGEIMTILVGYSPSPEGRAAVDFGIEQARAFDDVVVVLNAGIGETPDERGVATSKDIEELKETLQSSEVSHEILQFLRGN